jgi:hypothetical protein
MKEYLIEKMYEISKKPYQKYFKKNAPWTIDKKELLAFPEESLGFHLGCFLIKYHFEIQPKLEDHDVFHVLTNTGITVLDEIGMQFYLLGNGKRSLYQFMVITTGICFYPTRLKYFWNQYKRGKTAHIFHYLNFQKMLYIPVKTIQESFNIK